MISMTIQQWCDLHRFSRGEFYRLKKLGIAPRTFNVGRCVRITESANAEWLQARENESANAA